MRPVPVRSQPAFRAAILAVVLAATWIYDYVQNRDSLATAVGAALDLALLVALGLTCLFVFAQFVLPVTTLSSRMRLAARLWSHAWGVHGPVIFVQNGRRVERRGEAGRKGPGLVWVDTASAALTRVENGPRRVLGPGIHLTAAHERLEKVFSLHIQTCTLGPGQDERIFDKSAEEASEEERDHNESVRAKRQAVSGWTRDGNEVVPEIRVAFKLDGQPAAPGRPGSRFGFSSEAVERAAQSEGVTVDPATSQRVHVAWNQLPGLIAVDLWREYVGKYTLEDLFSARFGPAPDVIQPEEPAPQIPRTESGASAMPKGRVAQMLWRFNNRLESALKIGGSGGEAGLTVAPLDAQWRTDSRMLPGRDYTALQVIAHMVRARMIQRAVPILDESGRYARGHMLSEEFKRLRERGIRILDVTVSGFRFAPAVEEQIVQNWRTSWLETAAGEREHVEQLEALAAEAGRQRALLEHAGVLSKALRDEPTTSVPAALKALLVASHGEILTDERLRGRGSEALAGISGLAKWVESPNND